MKRKSYLFLAYSSGSRTRDVCRDMVELMFSRIQMPTPNNKLEVYSDGNDDYTVALRDYYPMQCLRYGQVVKIREGGRIVDKIKRSVYGDPDIKQIETTDEIGRASCRERV